MNDPSTLWAKARMKSPEEVQQWIHSIKPSGLTVRLDIDSLINQTKENQKEFQKKRTSFIIQFGDHRLDIRKCFDRIVHWLDMFKGIGDVASSFDPVHAAFPWAAFRFVLQVAVASKDYKDNIIVLLSWIPHFVFSGNVLEHVYRPDSMELQNAQDNDKGCQAVQKLNKELVKFYISILKALMYSYLAFEKSWGEQVLQRVFRPGKPEDTLKDLEVQHNHIKECGEHCGKILGKKFTDDSRQLLGKLETSISQLDDRVSEMLTRMNREEWLETMRRISDILYKRQHQEISNKRTEGTCKWLLERSEFLEWGSSSASVIMLYGKPGSGKTFLISKVVDYCVDNAETNEAVAYFYCRRDEPRRREALDILRSIVRQLAAPIHPAETGTIHQSLKGLPDELESSGTTFDIPICMRLIQELGRAYSKSTIILDAFDECNRDTRDDLIKTLANLVVDGGRIRVFISSRPEDDIKRHFDCKPVIEIKATDSERDISTFVELELRKDRRWLQLAPDVQDWVLEKFQKKSEGMFQWAALQITHLDRLVLWTEDGVKEQILASPEGLAGAYKTIWDQIQKKPGYEKQQARRAIQCVLCAVYPLRTRELSDMMQLDSADNLPGRLHRLAKDDIALICGNLIIYDEESNVWRFCHLSAREYIEENHYTMMESNLHVAVISLRYLQSGLFQAASKTISKPRPNMYSILSQPEVDDVYPDFRSKSDHYPDYNKYIVLEALRHTSIVDHDERHMGILASHLKRFLDPFDENNHAPSPLALRIERNGTSTPFQQWMSVFCDLSEEPPESILRVRRSRRERETSSIQVAARFGLFSTLRDWWEGVGDRLNDIQSNDQCSLLSTSIKNGREDIWRFLLDKGLDVNWGSPLPLITSILSGNVGAFEALIEAGADVNGVDCDTLEDVDVPLKAALLYSSRHGQSNFTCTLLEEGAVTTLQTKSGSPLEYAARWSLEADVRLLLQYSTEIDIPETLLEIATLNDKANLVPLFLDTSPKAKTRELGVRLLMRAIGTHNTRYVRSLFRRCVVLDLSLPEDRLLTLFYMKLEDFGIGGICALFRGSMMDLNGNNGKQSLLSLAIILCIAQPSFYISHVEQVINAGADVNQVLPDCMLPTPLITAAAGDDEEIIHLICDAGGDPDFEVDIGFGNALVAAAFYGRPRSCRILLEKSNLDLNEERKGFFQNVLFALIAGHQFYSKLGLEGFWSPQSYCLDPGMVDLDSKVYPWNEWRGRKYHNPPKSFLEATDRITSKFFGVEGFRHARRFGRSHFHSEHIQLLQLLFESGLHVYIPLYSCPSLLSPSIYFGPLEHRLRDPMLLHKEGCYGTLSQQGLFLLCELATSQYPKPPFHLLLRRCGLFGSLPQEFKMVARSTASTRSSSDPFLILYVQDQYYQLGSLRAGEKCFDSCGILANDSRWKRYNAADYRGSECPKDMISGAERDPVRSPVVSSGSGDEFPVQRKAPWLFFSFSIVLVAYVLFLFVHDRFPTRF